MIDLRRGAKDTIFDFSAVCDGIFFLMLLIPDPCSDPEREKVHGDSEAKPDGKQPLLRAMLSEKAGNGSRYHPETAHDPEAVGSSPASAARKVLIPYGIGTFIFGAEREA